MAKSKKTLLILLAALVILAAVYGIYSVSQKRAAEQEEANKIYIGSLTGDITELTIFDNTETNTYLHDVAAGKWRWSEDAELPLRSTYLDSISENMKSLAADRSFPSTEALSAYGFDDPKLRVSATDSGGATLSLIFGNMLDEDESFYVMEDGGDTVYTMDTNFPELLTKSLLKMVRCDSAAILTEEQVRSVHIESGSLIASFRQEADGDAFKRYITVDGKTSELKNDEAEDSAYSLCGELFSSMSEVVLTDCAAWKPDEAALASYGLSEPYMKLTVSYNKGGEDGEYCVLAGGVQDETEYRYAMLDGSSMVCTFRATYVQGIIDDAAAAAAAVS